LPFISYISSITLTYDGRAKLNVVTGLNGLGYALSRLNVSGSEINSDKLMENSPRSCHAGIF